eukprot:scaffold22_cov401-Pavlova_lutheri.AAC.2
MHAQAGFVALHLTVAVGLHLEHPRGGQGGATRRKSDQAPSAVLGQRGELGGDGVLLELGVWASITGKAVVKLPLRRCFRSHGAAFSWTQIVWMRWSCKMDGLGFHCLRMARGVEDTPGALFGQAVVGMLLPSLGSNYELSVATPS